MCVARGCDTELLAVPTRCAHCMMKVSESDEHQAACNA